jgi:anti-sigma B factor antagonist
MELLMTEQTADTLVLQPIGRLDLLTAGEFKAQLTTAVTEGKRRIIIDMAHVSFVDSSGLGALISGLKAARRAGGDLRIAHVSQQTLTVLTLTTLDRVLRPYASVAEAMSTDD